MMRILGLYVICVGCAVLPSRAQDHVYSDQDDGSLPSAALAVPIGPSDASGVMDADNPGALRRASVTPSRPATTEWISDRDEDQPRWDRRPAEFSTGGLPVELDDGRDAAQAKAPNVLTGRIASDRSSSELLRDDVLLDNGRAEGLVERMAVVSRGRMSAPGEYSTSKTNDLTELDDGRPSGATPQPVSEEISKDRAAEDVVDFAADEKETVALPRELVLSGAFPNPFNPQTEITFSVPTEGSATLIVYDVSGRAVSTLFDGPARPAKVYRTTFDGSSLASGLYIYALESQGLRLSKKMLLVK